MDKSKEWKSGKQQQDKGRKLGLDGGEDYVHKTWKNMEELYNVPTGERVKVNMVFYGARRVVTLRETH